VGKKQYFIPPGAQPASQKMDPKKDKKCRDINPGESVDEISKLNLSVEQPYEKQRDNYRN